MKTAADAFLWCAGAIGSQAERVPAARAYAVAFRELAKLAKDIPCELPGPHVVAFALKAAAPLENVAPNSPEYTRRQLWQGLGAKLEELAPIPRQPGQIMIAPAEADLGPAAAAVPVLHEAIWLWQYMEMAAFARLQDMPRIGKDQNGRLMIQTEGGLLRAISTAEAAEIEMSAQVLAKVGTGLQMEIRVLIGQLCPERTAAVNKAESEQVMNLQRQELASSAESPA